MNDQNPVHTMMLWTYVINGGRPRPAAIRELYYQGVMPEDIATKGMVSLEYVQEALAFKDVM